MLSFILQLILLASGLVEVKAFSFSTIAWALALQGVLKLSRPTRLAGLVTKITRLNEPKKVNRDAGITINFRGVGESTARSSFPQWDEELVGNFHQVDLWVNKVGVTKLMTLFSPEGENGVVSLRAHKRLGLLFFHHSVGDKPRLQQINFRLKRKVICCNPQDLPASLRRKHLFPRGNGPVYVEIKYWGSGQYKVTLRCDHPND